MRRFLLVLAMTLLGAMGAAAQTTTATGTIVDPNGNPYYPGTASAYISLPSGQPTPTGVVEKTTPVATTSGGNFSLTLSTGYYYVFTLCSAPTLLSPPIPGTNQTPKQVCFSNSQPILMTGATLDVTATLNAVAAVLGPKTTSGGTVSGSGTANYLAIWNTSSSLGNSTCTDAAGTPTRCPDGMNTATQGQYREFTNDFSGTSAEKLACSTGNLDANGKATISTCAAGSTDGLVGVCEYNCGTSGTAIVCWTLGCPVLFTNTSVARHIAIVDPSVPGELSDTGSTAGDVGYWNFGVIAANTGAGTASPVDVSGLVPGNPAGGGGSNNLNFAGTAPIVEAKVGRTITYSCPTCLASGSNVTTATGTNPITVNGDNSAHSGAITIACPTCATASSSTTSTGTSAVTAGPAGARYTSVGVLGSPSPCQWYRAAEITNCNVGMTLATGDHVFVAYFNQATSCSINDTYGNTWTLDANLNSSSDRLFETTVTTGGSADQIISSSGCLSGTGYTVTMVVFRTAGEAGVDNTANIVGFGPDTCGSYGSACTSTVTTANASDAVIFVSATQIAGTGTFTGQGVIINPPMNIVSLNADNINEPVVAITGEPYSGSYVFTYTVASNPTGGGGGAFGLLIPMKSSPSVFSGAQSTLVGSGTNPSLTITVSAGQTWLAVAANNDNFVGGGWPSGCNLTDSLGNSWTATGLGAGGYGVAFTSTITTGGSDTISPNSTCNVAGQSQNTFFGAVAVVGMRGIDSSISAGVGAGNWSINVRNPYDIVVAGQAYINAVGSAFRISPSLTQLASGTSPNAWDMEGALVPTAQGFTWTGLANAMGWAVAVVGAGSPALPTAARKLNPYDMSVPQLQAAQIVTPIPATGCNGGPCLLYRGDLSTSFQTTLTENIASSDYGSFVDGSLYTFNICENATGGWTVAWTSNGTVIAVNPPTINTAANACTTASAVWNGAKQKLYFLASVVSGIEKVNTASCTTGTSANATCTVTVTWPVAFPDTNYLVLGCVGNTANSPTVGVPYIVDYENKLTTGITVRISNGQGSAAVAATFTNGIDCSASE